MARSFISYHVSYGVGGGGGVGGGKGGVTFILHLVFFHVRQIHKHKQTHACAYILTKIKYVQINISWKIVYATHDQFMFYLCITHFDDVVITNRTKNIFS